MPLDLDLDLRLDERGDDHVLVTVLIGPTGRAAPLEGVALQLFSGAEAIGPRTLLPIAGTLRALVLTSVVLHAHDEEPIPPGCRVVATAWHGVDQREASIPTDPGTAFEAHVRGLVALGDLRVDPARGLEPLEPEERAMIRARLPWIDHPLVPRGSGGELEVMEAETSVADTVAQVADELGLDEETASWLNDLLDE